MQNPSDKAAEGQAPSQLGLAVLMAVAAMISVQLGAALAKPAMDSFGPFAVTWGRLAWAAILLWLIVRPDIRSYRPRDLAAAIALGATIAVMTLTFYLAIMRVPLGLVVAIEFLGPLSVAAFGFARSWRLIWLVLAFVGVLLLVRNLESWTIDLLGLVFALAAGTGWGTYIVLNKHVGSAFKGLDGLAISFVAAALIATPFGLYETGLGLPGGLIVQTVGLAVLTPLLPYVLEMQALRRLPSATFGILMSAEPGIGALAGYLILHEPLSPQQIAGIACVICASVGATVSARS
ncbi:DMT family transporter [Mesorhizobium sp. UC22_110]|uniref:EamA family transporter n=1 Tax=unclassified Mesorhizobium TaxID=325217 RepID=UPI003672FBA0